MATYSAILRPSSLLEGWELAVKMTRPPLAALMSCGLVSTSRDSGSGSLGTQALLSPSYQQDHRHIVSLTRDTSCKYKGKMACLHTRASQDSTRNVLKCRQTWWLTADTQLQQHWSDFWVCAIVNHDSWLVHLTSLPWQTQYELITLEPQHIEDTQKTWLGVNSHVNAQI